jgi:hypothetical protein
MAAPTARRRSVDLLPGTKVGDFVRELIRDGIVTACARLLRRRSWRRAGRNGDGLRHRRQIPGPATMSIRSKSSSARIRALCRHRQHRPAGR